MSLKKVTDNAGFKDAVDEVDESELRQIDTTTPLTSEDGCIHGEKMLYGYFDEETGTLYDTFSYREMDGRDEEAINKSEVKTNGAKLANVLVERCVTEIGVFKKSEMGTKAWADFVRKLCGGDLDYMMVKIRELSKGDTVTFSHKCPRCGTKLTTEMKCSDFEVTPFEGKSIYIPFELPRGYKDKNGNIHKTGTVRLANGYDREVITPLYAKNRAVATTKMLMRIMQFDDETPLNEDCLRSMSLRDRDYLEKLVSDNSFGIEMKFDELKCPSCGNDLSSVQGSSDFF